MTSLLDLMSEEERRSVAKLRNRGVNNSIEVSPINLLVAKLGYFYGWSAIESVKRGYVEKGDTRIVLSMEEVSMLVEAGEKIHAQHMIDVARATRAGVASGMSDKHPKQIFEKGVECFIKRAKV